MLAQHIIGLLRVVQDHPLGQAKIQREDIAIALARRHHHLRIAGRGFHQRCAGPSLACSSLQ